MVIKLSNNGAPKKFFESNCDNDGLILYKRARLILTVKHIFEDKDIYDAIEITPSEFVKNLQDPVDFKNYSNLAKFLFLLSEKMPFTLVIAKIINGEEENVEMKQKVFYGHKILFIIHGLTDINSKLISHQLKKAINKNHKTKWIPKTCIQSSKKLLKIQCKMLVDFEKCYDGNLKKLLKMIKVINKKQIPLKFVDNDSTVPFHPGYGLSDAGLDNAIKVITLSLNIYETIEHKFLGGNNLIRDDCENQILYYKTNFQTFIADLKIVLQLIINKYANFEPASSIAKFLPGIYQSCFYLFTNLLENITLVKEIEKCSEILECFFEVNKIVSELIWFSKQWFYLFHSNSKIAERVLIDSDPSKFIILVNSETFNQIEFLYEEDYSNILWMFDPNPSNDCEPKLISEHKKYLFEISESKKNFPEKTTFYSPRVLTYEILKDDNKPRFLLCSICKSLQQTIHSNPVTVKCQCEKGLLKIEEHYGTENVEKSETIQSKILSPTIVTTEISMKLTPQFGEIFVDVIEKPNNFASVTQTFSML